MSTAQNAIMLSPEDYLKSELEREIKHEYVDGYIYAMAGASPNHGRISSNIARKIGNHLENSAC
jgi:Uma2 family endonuclease